MEQEMNQLLIIGAAAIALVAAYNINNAAVRTVAVQNERASVEQKATKKDAIAQTARAAAADKPDSVLQKYCRDCGKSGAVQIVEADDSFKAGPPDKTDGRGNRSR
jgi:hypothetical protein